MRTTLDLPGDLISEAQKVSHCRTKTEVITRALENLIRYEKMLALKNFKGTIKLDIDLDAMRKR